MPKIVDDWLGIVHDEVSLRQELVFDDMGKLVGFVDLGSTQNSIDCLEYSLSNEGDTSFSPDEVTHVCFHDDQSFFEIEIPYYYC